MYVIRHFLTIITSSLAFVSFVCSYASAETLGSSEVEVYAAYINQSAKDIPANKSLVIESTTELLPNVLTGDSIAEIKTLFPEASETVISNFVRVGASSVPFSIPRRLVLQQISFSIADEENIRKVFENDSLAQAWKQFYDAYPSATGLIRFSRVGIDAEKNQALLYVAHSCGGLCGNGFVVLLQLKWGRWVVVRSEHLWVS